MNEKLMSLLKELEKFGAENDTRVTTHHEKMLNITPDTGAFLALLIRAMKTRRVLEISTSNGYSTIWLADAVRRLAGRVVTVELLPSKVEMARTNFERAGVSESIQLHLSDGGEFLKEQSDASFEFIFLDSDRGQYITWWPHLQRVLTPGGLLVMDNAVSHAAEVEHFISLIRATPGYTSALVPVGSGEFLVLVDN